MRCIWTVLLTSLGLTSSTAASLGCSDCSVYGQDPVVYEGGTTNASRTIYQSSAVEAPLLHFPQGRVYEFHHGLGAAPVTVDIFVSFCEQLQSCDKTSDKKNPNNVALSAGNQSLIEAWDDEVVVIRNDTCENNFYVRVVALADPDAVEAAGGQGGASADGQGGADGLR
ncbi:MAG TPA: hypothetical protein VN764_05965 [Polyangiaceae bacterium]|nr:hypothetical protein [Polyangiaceae bacterium]